MVQRTTTTLINHLVKVKKDISKDYPVERMIFFGSRARGKPYKWSDIDLIIVSLNFRKMDFIERGAKMYDYWNLNYPVNFICYTPHEFKTREKHTTLVSQAIKTSIEIENTSG